MKRRINIILSCTVASLALIVTVIGLTGEYLHRQERLCRGIDVRVDDYPEIRFVNRDEVVKIIDNEYGGYLNRPVDSLNTHKIEKLLIGKGVIRECVSYITRDGVLHVKVLQSKPVASLNCGQQKYYLDSRGRCFNVNEDWCGSIVRIYGLSDITDEVWNARVAAMSVWLGTQEPWMERIEKMEADGKGDISVFIKDKKEKFLIGQPAGYIGKFTRIGKYLEKIGTDKEYKTVNVKYKGQIVCK